MMRTLSEIVESTKTNQHVEFEELKYALLVYVGMLNSDHRKLRETLLAEKPAAEFIRKMMAENSYDMYHKALNTSPKEYLGWSNDPENPEYQKFHTMGNKLIDKIMDKHKKQDNG